MPAPVRSLCGYVNRIQPRLGRRGLGIGEMEDVKSGPHGHTPFELEQSVSLPARFV
jgi:hypothetical protein